MLASIGLLILGFIGLVAGSHWLVEGAASLAQRLGVPTFVVGLTVVAFGTSAPELIVGVQAAYNGNSGIVLGNVLGSNIANVCLILGVTSLICPIVIHAKAVRRETMQMAVATLVAGGLLLYSMTAATNESIPQLMPWQGLVLLGCFIVFLAYQFSQDRKRRRTPHSTSLEEFEAETEIAEEVPDLGSSVLLDIIKLVAGLALLVGGGKAVVTGAVNIAKAFEVSDQVIGVTIVAIGTSLPELFASITAARRNHAEMVIGNVIGSNIFNLLLVLGVAGCVAPLDIANSVFTIDVPLMVASALVCLPLVWMSRPIGRGVGLTLCVIYAGYLGATLIFGTA